MPLLDTALQAILTKASKQQQQQKKKKKSSKLQQAIGNPRTKHQLSNHLTSLRAIANKKPRERLVAVVNNDTSILSSTYRHVNGSAIATNLGEIWKSPNVIQVTTQYHKTSKNKKNPLGKPLDSESETSF